MTLISSSYSTSPSFDDETDAQSQKDEETSSVCGKFGTFLMYAGICIFYMTEMILLYKDVHFYRVVSEETQFFLGSTAATAMCGTLTWGLMSISVFTRHVPYVRDGLRLGTFLGIGGLSIMWIINIVITGLWNFGHLSQVSRLVPSYFFTLYSFNIVFGFVGFYVFLVSVAMVRLKME